MAEFDDALNEFNTVQEIERRRQQQKQQQEQAQEQRQQRRSADTVGGALEPVLDAEKTDIQFWMIVAQTVLLLVIARELRSGG